MLSLLFGLVAALAWGVHDVCVRFAVERAGVPLALAAVMAAGLVLITPVAILYGDWQALSPVTAAKAAASGLAYAVGGYALYRAFAIGPVRLVAPIIGAYPILSLLWAAVQGQPPTIGQGLAVLVIIGGVAAGAILAGHGHGAGGRTRDALFWSVAAAFGFALTFAFGQSASHGGDELASVLIARATCLAVIVAAMAALAARPRLDRAPWGLFAVMGLCDGVALGLVQAAGGLPRPEFASVAASVFGMVTILLAWAFLKERMTPPQWASVALVFAGVGYLAT